MSYNPKIAEMLRDDPTTLLEDAVEALKNLIKYQTGGKLKQKNYFVTIATKDDDSPLATPIREFRSDDIDQLVWFKGITIRTSIIRPKLTKASFECTVCGTQFDVPQFSSKIKWAKFCINKRCKAKVQGDFKLLTKTSEFIDWQSIMIQERPEDVPSGRMPKSTQAILKHDLVDTVKPGDRVEVMGIYRPILAQSTKGLNSTLFRSQIEVNFIDPEDKSDKELDITKEEKEQIEKLSKEPLIQKKIARSIAPIIFGRPDLKMAAALSLFGGRKKKKTGGGWKRGDIHVFFVGDPGTGKSEILKSAQDIAPRGLYTSGKGSTAVGLTAAVVKDEAGQMNLEAGAVVLANGGVAAIDEFDKMDSQDRSALHEVMEQQTVSIAKAGIVANLKAETAIIAAANPYFGRYDSNKPIAQNIRMPPALISRFDLIFVVKDKAKPADDAQLAEFILQHAMRPPGKEDEEDTSKDAPISGDLLKKYIKYAKKN